MNAAVYYIISMVCVVSVSKKNSIRTNNIMFTCLTGACMSWIVSLAISKRKSDKSNLFYTKLRDNIISWDERKSVFAAVCFSSTRIPALKMRTYGHLLCQSIWLGMKVYLPITISVHHRDSLEKSHFIQSNEQNLISETLLHKKSIFFKRTDLFTNLCQCWSGDVMQQKYLTIISRLIFT